MHRAQPAFEPGDRVLRLRVGKSKAFETAEAPLVLYTMEHVARLEVLAFLKVDDKFVPMSTGGNPPPRTPPTASR